MEIKVYNPSFVAIGILETAESIIWKDRYNDVGDFEIYTRFDPDIVSLLAEDNLITIPDSDRMMIIESVNIKTNTNKQNKLIVKGRSLESILDRRIVLRQIFVDDTFQNGVEAILNEDVIDGTYPERNFPNFIFSPSSDPLVTTPTLKGQYYSQNLLEVIKSLCVQAGLGFKITLNSSNQFVFALYSGHDRSYAQTTNPYVVFSPDFDNLINSEYYHSRIPKKNYILVSGNTPQAYPGYPYRKQVWLADIGTGLSRREMFADATDIPLFILDSSTELSEATYLDQLAQRGYELLAANGELTIFDGQIQINKANGYFYNTDFFLGDIVQLDDGYGHIAGEQITEITFSQNLAEKTVYPTLRPL